MDFAHQTFATKFHELQAPSSRASSKISTNSGTSGHFTSSRRSPGDSSCVMGFFWAATEKTAPRSRNREVGWELQYNYRVYGIVKQHS